MANKKNMLMRVGELGDNLLAVVAPGMALSRQEARRSYAAAKTPRAQAGFWFPGMNDKDPNGAIRTSLPTVRARTRQLVRDFPIFTSALDNMVAFRAGDGYRFMSQVRDADSLVLDRKTCQQIEDGFQRWQEKCDTTGKLAWADIQQLCERQEGEAGEYLMIKKFDRAYGQNPFRLLALDPDQIEESVTGLNPRANIEVDQGVEYDITDGEIIAYHFAEGATPYSNQKSFSQSTRVGADQILHDFVNFRPHQHRGISIFAPAILMAAALSDYVDSELDAQSMAAKIFAFIEQADIAGGGDPRKANKAGELADGKPYEYLDGLTKIHLKAGQKPHHMPGVTRPTAGLDFFCQMTLRFVSMVSHVPFEILASDYRGMNYSVSKRSQNDFRVKLKPHHGRRIRHLCTPVFRQWLDMEVATGGIYLKNYWNNQAHYQRGLWIPPGFESNDPLREARGYIEMINAGLMAPQEIILGRGADPDSVKEMLKEWYSDEELTDLMAKIQQKVAVKTNPAAVGAAETKPAKGKRDSTGDDPQVAELIDRVEQLVDTLEK